MAEFEIVEVKETDTGEVMISYRIRDNDSVTPTAHLFMRKEQYNEYELQKRLKLIAEEYYQHKPRKYVIRV